MSATAASDAATKRDVSLGDKARAGLLWNTGFKVGHAVLQLIIAVVLVRLLTPEDYGVYAVASGIVGFLSALAFESFAAYILQVGRDEEVDYDLYFTGTVGIQIVTFVLTNLGALALRYVPGYEAVANGLHALSPMLLFVSVGGFRVKMLERELDWRRLRTLQLIGLTGVAASSVALALCGAGVYALLLSPHVKYLPFIADLFLAEKWRPRWKWSAEAYRPAWRFGLNRAAAASIGKGRAVLETNVMAGSVGLVALGEFGRAVGLGRLGCGQVSLVVMQSVYPALTRLDPASPAYLRAGRVLLRGIGWTAIPVSVGVALLAEPTVRLLYGERWLGIVPLLPWGMAIGGITAVAQCAYQLLLASRRQGDCLQYDLATAAGTALALAAIWASGGGLASYAAALTGVEALGLLWLARAAIRAGAVDAYGFLSALVHPAAAAAASVVVAASVTWAADLSTRSLPGAAAFGLLFGATYLLLLRLTGASSLKELVDRMPARRALGRMLFLERLIESPSPAGAG